MPTVPDEETLESASRQMLSPVKPERESAERTLLSARDEALPHLCRALEVGLEGSHDAGILGRIALLLGAFRARDALPPLCAAAMSEKLSADDTALVARAIAEIADGRDAFDDRVRDAIERLAADSDRYTRAFAAKGFGALGDVRSRARVEALAEDGDGHVRDAAEKVLLKLREAEVEATGGGMDSFAALVDQANAEGGALKPWLDDLADARRAVRDAAVAQLVGAGKQAVPNLIEQLNRPELLPRVGAAQALGRIQSPEAAGPLLIAATTPAATELERELVTVSLRALANCLTGVEEGLAPALLPLARSEDRFVRAAALLSLGRIADREGIRAVVEALTDKDPFVVESASIALSEGVREEDVELTIPLLEAYDAAGARAAPALREAILIALSRIQIVSEPLRVRVRHRVRREIRGPTAQVRKASIALLEGLYADDDPPVLPVLDDVLGRLADSHPEVRVVAASFLSRHLEPGFTGAVPRLIDAALKKERTLSLLCSEALRRHDTALAREALEALTRSDDSVVALRAAELVDGFEPATEEWRFTPKTRAKSRSKGSARAGAERPRVSDTPSRVRAASDEPVDDDGGVVQARFEEPVEAKTDDEVEPPAEQVEAADPEPRDSGPAEADAEDDEPVRGEIVEPGAAGAKNASKAGEDPQSEAEGGDEPRDARP
jgi:HEAT repeat protein